MRRPTLGQDGWITTDHDYFEFLRGTSPPRRVLRRQLAIDFSDWKTIVMVLGAGTAVLYSLWHGNVTLIPVGAALLGGYLLMLYRTMTNVRDAVVVYGVVRDEGQRHPFIRGVRLTTARVDDALDYRIALDEGRSLLSQHGTVEVAFLHAESSKAPYALVVAYRPANSGGRS
jgi:hypothetical protein